MKQNKYYPIWWEEGCDNLAKNDIVMKKLINNFSDNKLSSIKNPFFSLSKSIVGQQISVAAASAVWKRLENKYNLKIHFRPFIHIEGVSAKKVRRQKIDLNTVSQDLKISRLKRVRFGDIMLPRNLRVGKWVEITGAMKDNLLGHAGKLQEK